MAVSTKFFTNRDENTLLTKFQGVFQNNSNIAQFDALVGYLRASGYFAIRPELENVPKVRILVGIDVDEIVEEYQRQGRLFLADTGKCIREFKKQLTADIQNSRYSPEVEKGITQFVDDIVSRKLEVKAHPTKRLHAKIYIFLPPDYNEHKDGSVITGSSNLTAAGLGAEDREENYEFNVLLRDFDDVKFASDEFNDLWEEAVDILPKYVTEATADTYLREELSPFEIYIKLLIEYFGPAIEYDPNKATDLPEGYKRLAYQMDAVTQGNLMLQRHGGFFLSDVVGLGKTMIATMIAKKFFFHNDFPTHLSETLIVVPPALKEGWEEVIHQFGLKYVRIITNGSLHKIRYPDKYDLIIVDEAHKFRNDTSEAYDQLQKLCKTPTRRRLPDDTFAAKKVILVSATPLNNRPKDIANLLFLFQDSKDSTLDQTRNLQHYFATHQKEYEAALKAGSVEQSRLRVKEIYEDIRQNIMTQVTVRRTRTDLRETPDYLRDLNEQGIVFPEVGRPNKLFYPLSPALDTLYDETLRVLDKQLTYSRYQAIGNLIAEKKLRYQNADRVSSQLEKIMRTLLLKRLDSSFFAFTQSLSRFRDATRVMVEMFENGKIYIAPDLDVTRHILEGREDELTAKINELEALGENVEICQPQHFVTDFLPSLQTDLQLLESLCERWTQNTEDPKFDEFIHQLETTLLSPEINFHAATKDTPRLVIFSESVETTNYLVKRMKESDYNRILQVDSKSRKDAMPHVKANFDANATLEEQLDDYDILITTEVLAEGVNLHRANVIVNYDTPWNSTRLMQRIGRVNRIGTKADRIHVFNFFPTTKVESNIELEKKALVKLQAFHSALGEDSQIYSTDEEVDNFGLFDKDLEEERDESQALLTELREFRKRNPERFREIRNLPMRARTGRHDLDRKGHTIAFVKNKRRNSFYYLNESGDPEELSFIQAARIFHATAAEKPAPLHEEHHAHITSACEHFQKGVEKELTHKKVVDQKIGPNEKRANKFLEPFSKQSPLVSEGERNLVKLALVAIRRGTFQKLPSRIVKIIKENKEQPMTAAGQLDAILAVLSEYPLRADEDGSAALAAHNPLAGLTTADLKPAIILSESFTATDLL